MSAGADMFPSSTEWEFGSYRYGLEPLALPERPLRWSGLDDENRVHDLRKLLAKAAADVHPKEKPEDSDEERVYWFRWITGHQTTFITWQLLAGLLQTAKEPDVHPEKIAYSARMLTRCYSLMLVYSGSTPREFYERVIRPSLARHHANFSGAWARDYAPIRQLMRRKVDLGSGPNAAALRSEIEFNDQVHDWVAAKLVPTQVSFLQANNKTGGPQSLPRASMSALYDCAFHTVRGPVSEAQVIGQMVRRLHAIVLDVAANPLDGSGADRVAPEESAGSPSAVAGELLKSPAEAVQELLAVASSMGPVADPLDSSS